MDINHLIPLFFLTVPVDQTLTRNLDALNLVNSTVEIYAPRLDQAKAAAPAAAKFRAIEINNCEDFLFQTKKCEYLEKSCEAYL